MMCLLDHFLQNSQVITYDPSFQTKMSTNSILQDFGLNYEAELLGVMII